MRLAQTFAALALLVFVLNVHCSKTCTEMGCSDGAGGRVTVHVSTKDLLASTVTICRNGACSTGQPALPPGNGYAPESIDATMTGPVSATAMFVANDTTQRNTYLDATVPAVTDQTTSFDFVFGVTSGPFADGDTYVVTIARDGAPPITSIRKTVTYSFEQPNGADCDGTYGCKVATID